jgi:hypothetical protein
MFKIGRCNGGVEVVKKPSAIGHLKPKRAKIPNGLTPEERAEAVMRAVKSLELMTAAHKDCQNKIKWELQMARGFKHGNSGLLLPFDPIAMGNRHEEAAGHAAAVWREVHTLTYSEMCERIADINEKVRVEEEAARRGA